MKITIDRSEPTTGGPNRTPREQVEPVFTENDLVEVDAAIDGSTSEGWEGSSSPEPGAPPTWEVQMEAFRQLLAVGEQLDSQAQAEQAGGSDEKGGWYTAFFNHGLVKVGATQTDEKYVKGREEDDNGDLNTPNFKRKIAAIRVPDENGRAVPLPYGGTCVRPTIEYLDAHYMGEFEYDDDGSLVPVGKRPKRARYVGTDGAMSDYKWLAARLAEDHSDKWPAEEWFVAIHGHGTDHDATVKLYKDLAVKHPSVHVYSFDSVTNPAEIAEDMAVAMLARR